MTQTKHTKSTMTKEEYKNLPFEDKLRYEGISETTIQHFMNTIKPQLDNILRR